MGYPMTWQRVINRNGLADGDYTTPPQRWGLQVNTSEAAFSLMSERLDGYQRGAMALAGDLRRLERDGVDEGALCREVARRSGVDPDAVAAVLLTFFAM